MGARAARAYLWRGALTSLSVSILCGLGGGDGALQHGGGASSPCGGDGGGRRTQAPQTQRGGGQLPIISYSRGLDSLPPALVQSSSPGYCMPCLALSCAMCCDVVLR